MNRQQAEEIYESGKERVVEMLLALSDRPVDPESLRRIDWAISEYRSFLGDPRPSERIANTIRSAAAAGRIGGATQDGSGAWHFRPATFRAWLVRTRNEKRGRPRRTGAGV